MPLLTLAATLAAKFAPSLIGKLTGSDKAEKIAENVVNIAKSATGQNDPDQAVKILDDNPEIALKFQQEIHMYELSIAQEETKRILAEAENLKNINNTIVAAIYKVPTGFIWEHIPSAVYVLWAMVLGVYVVSRGKEKITDTKLHALQEGKNPSSLDISGILGKIL